MKFRGPAVAILFSVCGFACATSTPFDGSTDDDAGTGGGNQDTGTADDTGGGSSNDAAFAIDTGLDAGGGGNDSSTGHDATPPVDSGADVTVVVDSGSDATIVDAGIDTGIDAGIDSGVDAGVDSGTDASVGCSPQSVSGFTPTWVPPTAGHQNKCTSTQINDFYTACLGTTATNATCTAFQTSNAACSTCLVTADNASAYGPVISKSNGVVSLNLAGCVVIEDSSQTTCGHSMQAQTQCEDRACKANCPVTDNASFTLYQNCVSSADTGGCSTYTTAATNCENAISIFSNAQTCFQGSTFQALYTSVAPVFCGP